MKAFGIDFKFATPLELQVTSAGLCPYCHKKILVERYRAENILWMQCTRCYHAFCLPIEDQKKQ